MGKVNESDLAWESIEDGWELARKKVGVAAGGEEIGCSLYRLPEGNRSWPYHYHTGNEEALFVLEGRGTLRLNDETIPLESGDYVSLRADESGAHRVSNDSPGSLRYLMISTMVEPDVAVYPDSGKIGVFAGSPPGGDGERHVRDYFRTSDAVDYWTDESYGDEDT